MKRRSQTVFVLMTAALLSAFLTACTVDIRFDTHNDDGAAADTEKAKTQVDITLRDAVVSDDGLGTSALIGACVNGMNIHDPAFTAILRENYNAVTLENELKPDAMFGYSNEVCPLAGMHEEEVDGVAISVPALDHSRADAILDVIASWNEENPDRPIKVRGHVLVWHSQTPEWFFHEDYDPGKDYVSKEEMDRRLEWYIRSVLEYYTGKDSKYRGLFYGWDVVNEAISDRTGTYRTDTEPGSDKLTDPVHASKSSWWKVYGSNEYIINAFRYANRYAPADLALYYNDYNECNSNKKKGILSLISDVRSAEGTRIDGFGMQGHYSVNDPVADAVKEAAAEYAEAAGSVMLTELDVKPSIFYNGTDEALPEEYGRQAAYYGDLYKALKELAGDGINVTGICFWGVTDKYTWLEGKHPLLFDEDYEKKPAYFAFVTPSGGE